MSVIQIQNKKIKERAVENLSISDIKITKENIKKNIENTKNVFDVGYPFFKPFNIKRKSNLKQSQYETYFKTLLEDIDTLFISKSENLEDIEKLRYTISNNRVIVKKALKDLQTQISTFSENDLFKNFTSFNFNKVNDLEFLTLPYTDAYVDLENAIVYNDIKEFNTHNIKDLEMEVYAETVIDNKETINTIESIYNNKEIDMFKFKAITSEEKEVTINLDITNKDNDRINEIILKVQSNDKINVKLFINNNNEYIIQDSKDILSKTSFEVNREASKIRLSMTKKFDYRVDENYVFNFFIENIILNKNTFENENYVVTKPIKIETEYFKMIPEEIICHSGDIEYFYTLDTDVLDWIGVNKKEKTKLPSTLIEQKVINGVTSDFFSIKYGNKYAIDLIELSDKERLELFIGEDLESVEYFTSDINKELYKTIFNNNIIDKSYFKSKDKKAIINFRENEFLYLKTLQTIELKQSANLKTELLNISDINLENSDTIDKFQLVDLKAFLNDVEITNGEIKVDGKVTVKVIYKYRMKDLELNKEFEVATIDYNVFSEVKESQIKNVYGAKGVLNSNRDYNNFSIDDKNRLFIFTNPADNILSKNQDFNIIMDKKMKERNIRIMAKMVKEKEIERNVIKSISVLEVD